MIWCERAGKTLGKRPVRPRFSTAGGNLVLAAALLPPVVNGAEALLVNPDCASLFDVAAMESTFGTTSPESILEQAYSQNQIRLVDFGSNIPPATMGETTGVNGTIYFASNRGFATGILADGTPISQAPLFLGLGLTNLQIDEILLIHELLHFTGTAGDDDQNQSITLGNGDTVIGSAGITKEVIQHCIH